MTTAEWNRRNTPCPSVKALLAAFQHLSEQDAKMIRNNMREKHPRHAMDAIDGFLGTHGVEYIPQGHNSKSPAITYCNTGDSYGVTVLYVNGRYRIGTWGDIVERGNYD